MPDALIIQHQTDGSVAVAYQRDGDALPEPAGSPILFTSPLTSQDREDLRWYLEAYLTAPYAVWEDRGQAIAARLDSWGEALFAPLFGPGAPGEIVYQRAREHVAEVVLSGTDPAFLSLPWELMKDPDRPTPLALALHGLSRRHPAPAWRMPLPKDQELRMLMVIARPEGPDDVDFQMVARPLHEVLTRADIPVTLDVLRPPTIEALEARLLAAAEAGWPYHVVHFDGHGAYDRTSDSATQHMYEAQGQGGVLLFEDDTGGRRAITASTFAGTIRRGQVPVVILNACQSATLGEDANAAVATRLLAEGIPAVVAMSHSVYAVAAAAFMAKLYEALVRGKDMVAAVGAGRRALAASRERPSPKGALPLADWMVPVLYAHARVTFDHLVAPPLPAKGGGINLGDYFDATAGQRETPEAAVTTDPLAAPATGFVGRGRDFHTLDLAARHQRVVLIQGPGGTGKTALATAFARWWRDTGGLAGPNLVFFHGFEPGLASFGLDGLVTQVGMRLFGPDFVGRTQDAAHRCAALVRAMRQNAMLLILDNFETVASMPDPSGATRPLDATGQADLRAFLAALAAPGGQSVALITSRAPEGWLDGDGFAPRRLVLGGLPKQEAAELAGKLLAPYATARQRWRDPRARESTEALMTWLEGHPLSMTLILPHLETHAAAALLAGLKGQGPLPPGFEGEGRTRHLGASVRYSLDHLSVEDRALLPVLSLVEGVVDGDVLAAFSGVEEAPAPFAGVSRDQWETLLDRAAGLGLLTALGAGTYRLHPALPAYLAALWRSQAGDAAETQRAAAEAALITAHADFGAWLLQQIQGGDAALAFGLIALQRRTLGRLIETALRAGRVRPAQEMLQPLDQFFDAQGLLQEKRGWLSRSVTATEGPQGAPPDLETEAGALWLFAAQALANMTYQAGELDAAQATYEVIRKALEAAPASKTRDHRLAPVYHQLGMVAQYRGDWDAAEDWYRKALAIAENLDNRPYVAAIAHQLGMVAQYRGDGDAAETWYRKSLEIEEALSNRPGMATSYLALALLAEQWNEGTGALAWVLRALLQVQDLDLPITAGVWAHLARLHRQHGRETVAAAWHQVTGEPAPEDLFSTLDQIAADLDDQTPEKAPS